MEPITQRSRGVWQVRSGVRGTAVAVPVTMCLPASRTQEALKSGHFVDVLSILLRLQRICNHPGLVEPRLPESSYTAGPLQYRLASLVLKALDRDSWKVVACLASHRCAVAPAALETAVCAPCAPQPSPWLRGFGPSAFRTQIIVHFPRRMCVSTP